MGAPGLGSAARGRDHYHKRSNVETTFSMIKAKFGDIVLPSPMLGNERGIVQGARPHPQHLLRD